MIKERILNLIYLLEKIQMLFKYTPKNIYSLLKENTKTNGSQIAFYKIITVFLKRFIKIVLNTKSNF